MSIEDDLSQPLPRDGRVLCGTPVTGCQLAESECLALLAQHYPDQPYCLVKDWLLLDLQAPPEAVEMLKAQGFKPRMVFAHCVVRDSQERFPVGGWVRTSFEANWDQANGVFQSCNTIYVLMGPGYRKTLPLVEVFSWC